MAQGKGTLLQTITAVAWSFFGVRRSADLERDAQQLKPAQLIVAGLVGAAIFVLSLVLLVNWVVASAH
jgi:Tfp pilus assembly protein PilN